jgi:hypothetical protein
MDREKYKTSKIMYNENIIIVDIPYNWELFLGP